MLCGTRLAAGTGSDGPTVKCNTVCRHGAQASPVENPVLKTDNDETDVPNQTRREIPISF